MRSHGRKNSPDGRSTCWFCQQVSRRGRINNTMGKWAQYQKRGGARITGNMSAPIAGNFTIGTVTTTTIPVNRVAAIPAPATQAGVLVVHNLSGAVAFENNAAGTPITATGLTSGVTYRVYAAWFANNVRLSDWFLVALQATL